MSKLTVCCRYCVDVFYFFFFKQKTAYEMRISDWSSDVCSSDLPFDQDRQAKKGHAVGHRAARVDAAFGQRAAFVKAGQIIGMLDVECGERRVVGDLLDRDHHAFDMRLEHIGQRCERRLGHRMEGIGVGRGAGRSEEPLSEL